jgi:hypothetical protein
MHLFAHPQASAEEPTEKGLKSTEKHSAPETDSARDYEQSSRKDTGHPPESDQSPSSKASALDVVNGSPNEAAGTFPASTVNSAADMQVARSSAAAEEGSSRAVGPEGVQLLEPPAQPQGGDATRGVQVQQEEEGETATQHPTQPQQEQQQQQAQGKDEVEQGTSSQASAALPSSHPGPSPAPSGTSSSLPYPAGSISNMLPPRATASAILTGEHLI